MRPSATRPPPYRQARAHGQRRPRTSPRCPGPEATVPTPEPVSSGAPSPASPSNSCRSTRPPSAAPCEPSSQTHHAPARDRRRNNRRDADHGPRGRPLDDTIGAAHRAPLEAIANSVVRTMLIMYVRCESVLGHICTSLTCGYPSRDTARRAASELIVPATASKEPGCSPAASVQPPTSSIGATAEETKPHHGTLRTTTTIGELTENLGTRRRTHDAQERSAPASPRCQAEQRPGQRRIRHRAPSRVEHHHRARVDQPVHRQRDQTGAVHPGSPRPDQMVGVLI